jgi:ectoine hydroxylase-related dioxygenase (phytanoyl-CoA dioxygenase family)
MREFTDSTALRADPEALRHVLDTEGYLLLRGLLPEEGVAAVRRHVLAVAKEHGWTLDSRTDGMPDANPREQVFEGQPGFSEVHRKMWFSRDFHALAHDASLLGLMTVLLDDEVLVHPRKVLRAVFPGTRGGAVGTGWHQDYPEIQGSSATLTMWAPLAGVRPEYGSLIVLPRSHGHGLAPLRLSDTTVGWEADISAEHEPCWGTLDPGDVLIFSGLTIHKSGPNRGRGLRLSVDFRYQPLSDPISRNCLDIVSEPYEWDNVYTNWAPTDDLRYYWRRQRPRIVEYDRRFDQWRESAGLDAARQGNPRARRAVEIAAAYGSSERVRSEASALLEALDRLSDAGLRPAT